MSNGIFLAAMLAVTCTSQVKIEGNANVEQYKLVRLKASNVDEKAAVLWRVNPHVDRATTIKGLLEFTAPPGKYNVELLVIASKDGVIDVQESFLTVSVGGATQPPTPDPKPPIASPSALNALARIRFGNSGCTATIIGPRRSDGRWNVLTAAHCMPGKGSKGSMTLKDGRTLGITVVEHQSQPDVAWAVTDEPVADLPFARLSERNAVAGTKVWHAGYGVDRPGNREDGEITRADTGYGQAIMTLNVSSGDSGGGIFNESNELVSVVCCTQGKGVKTTMYGCNAETARKFQPETIAEILPATIEPGDWEPMEIPIIGSGS